MGRVVAADGGCEIDSVKVESIDDIPRIQAACAAGWLEWRGAGRGRRRGRSGQEGGRGQDLGGWRDLCARRVRAQVSLDVEPLYRIAVNRVASLASRALLVA